MTSLGMLGEYGSGSEISDSDDECEPTSNSDHGNQQQHSEGNTSAPAQVDMSNSNVAGDPLNFAQNGDSSSSENSEGEGDELEREASNKEKTSVPLPLPELDRFTSPSATLSSVFSNPYKEAEEAKLAILKRHVSELAPDEKPSPQHHRTKYRKRNRAVARGGRGFTEATPTGDGDRLGLFGEDDSSVSEFGVERKRKQRSGVSGTLVPPKKYLKSYEKIQAEERPWTVRTLPNT